MNLTWRDLCGNDPNPMTVREGEALQYLCALLPDNPIIVQIGAERGASTLAMLDQLAKCFLLSIDYNTDATETQNLKRAGADWQRVVRGLGRSQDIGVYWPSAWRADMVYIDGDHKRPGIDQDLQLWSRVVKEGGVLAMHDYIPPEQRARHIVGRVWEAVEEWRPQAPEFEEMLCVGRLIAFLRS